MTAQRQFRLLEPLTELLMEYHPQHLHVSERPAVGLLPSYEVRAGFDASEVSPVHLAELSGQLVERGFSLGLVVYPELSRIHG